MLTDEVNTVTIGYKRYNIAGLRNPPVIASQCHPPLGKEGC